MKFVPRTAKIEVEAARIEHDGKDQQAMVTALLSDNTGRFDHYGSLVIATNDQLMFSVAPGDWLVKRDGKLFAMTDEAFNITYAAAPEMADASD